MAPRDDVARGRRRPRPSRERVGGGVEQGGRHTDAAGLAHTFGAQRVGLGGLVQAHQFNGVQGQQVGRVLAIESTRLDSIDALLRQEVACNR